MRNDEIRKTIKSRLGDKVEILDPQIDAAIEESRYRQTQIIRAISSDEWLITASTNESEYIVGLIRSMWTENITGPNGEKTGPTKEEVRQKWEEGNKNLTSSSFLSEILEGE